MYSSAMVPFSISAWEMLVGAFLSWVIAPPLLLQSAADQRLTPRQRAEIAYRASGGVALDGDEATLAAREGRR